MPTWAILMIIGIVVVVVSWIITVVNVGRAVQNPDRLFDRGGFKLPIVSIVGMGIGSLTFVIGIILLLVDLFGKH